MTSIFLVILILCISVQWLVKINFLLDNFVLLFYKAHANEYTETKASMIISSLKRVLSTFVIHSIKRPSSNKFYLFQKTKTTFKEKMFDIAGNVHNTMKPLKVFRVMKHGSWRRILIHLTSRPVFTNEETETQRDEIYAKTQS